MSGASRALASTAGLLARGAVRLALAMRGVRRRLDRLALKARERARPALPAAAPAAEVLADATIVMPLAPVVPGLPRVAPPPGASTSGGAKLPPPPRLRGTEGSLRS